MVEPVPEPLEKTNPINGTILPASLTAIDEEAFAGGNFNSVYIPASTTSIASGAFGDRTEMTIYGVPGSKAEAFANRKGYLFVPVG